MLVMMPRLKFHSKSAVAVTFRFYDPLISVSRFFYFLSCSTLYDVIPSRVKVFMPEQPILKRVQ